MLELYGELVDQEKGKSDQETTPPDQELDVGPQNGPQSEISEVHEPQILQI